MIVGKFSGYLDLSVSHPASGLFFAIALSDVQLMLLGYGGVLH